MWRGRGRGEEGIDNPSLEMQAGPNSKRHSGHVTKDRFRTKCQSIIPLEILHVYYAVKMTASAVVDDGLLSSVVMGECSISYRNIMAVS